MDFDFSPEQQAFADEVEAFLDEHDDPDVFDVTRENMAQIVDTPKRRAFMAQARRAGLARASPGPRSTAAREGEGVYEYLLNEALAGRGGPQIGKGVGIIGKTLIAPRQRVAEAGVPAEDPAQRGRVRGRLQRARRRLRRGVDAAQGRPARRRRLAAQRPEDVDHVGALRRVVLGRRPHRPRRRSTTASRCSSCRSTSPASRSTAIWTMGDERTNEVFFDDVFVPDDYVVGEVNQGFQYISRGARPRALHDVHVLADQAAPRPAVRLRRAPRTRRRRAAARRPGRPPAHRPARHRGRGRRACSGCASSPRR